MAPETERLLTTMIARDRQRSSHLVRCEPESFPDTGATLITDAIADAIRLRGHCAIALTGGASPRPVYERMAIPPFLPRVDWGRVSIYFGDERCVPPTHEESNYRMAHEALLGRIPIPSAAVHRMEGERAEHEAAARDYELLLPDRLDVLLLGMGEDGHTASLFPHSAALTEHSRRVVAVMRPEPALPRLTITPPVIRAAHAVIVLVSGAEKATTVARALEGDYAPDDLPIQLALGGTWLIDHPAARELGGTLSRPE